MFHDVKSIILSFGYKHSLLVTMEVVVVPFTKLSKQECVQDMYQVYTGFDTETDPEKLNYRINVIA